MSKIVLCSFSLFIMAILNSCNNDIFVDRIPDIEDSVYIEGDGGVHTITIYRENLNDISLDNNLNYQAFVTRYNAEGNILSHDASITEVSKIVYACPRFYIEVYIDGNKVTFKSVCNTYQESLEVVVYLMYGTLDYNYMSKPVTVHISPGSPMKMSDISYSFDNSIQEKHVSNPFINERFVNNTPVDQRIIYYPYKNAQSMLAFKVSGDLWASGISDMVYLPTYRDGEWVVSDDIKTELTIQSSKWIESNNIDKEFAITVDVPANTTVTVKLSLIFATLKVPTIIWLEQPFSGNLYPLDGECIISEPIDYSLTIE